jgi:hypothetical protein
VQTAGIPLTYPYRNNPPLNCGVPNAWTPCDGNRAREAQA